MSLKDCREVTFMVFDEFDVDSYYKSQTSFLWNNKLTRKIARAHVNWYHGRYKIDLSTKLFEYLSEKEKWDTYVHEACHLVDYILNPSVNHDHGPTWRSYMIKMGVEPKSCVKLSDPRTSKVGNRKKRYAYSCVSCGKSFLLTSYKHNRSQKYRCHCNNPINFTGKVKTYV